MSDRYFTITVTAWCEADIDEELLREEISRQVNRGNGIYLNMDDALIKDAEDDCGEEAK